MSTLADIRKNSTAVATGTDSTTPEGTFYAVAKLSIDDSVRTYLLRGQDGDDNAPILGVIVSDSSMAFRTSRLLGGTALPGRHHSSQEAFAQMV